MFASARGASMKEVRKATGGHVTYNIFPLLKRRGYKVERIGKRYKITRINSVTQREKAEWGDVAPDGRLLIPAQFRKKLGVDEDGHVLMRIENDELRVTSRRQALRQVQDLVARYVPAGESLVDSLIADRRAEAAREETSD